MRKFILPHLRVPFVGIALGAFTILTLSSCGYTLRGSETSLPPDVKSIYVPLIENNSPEGGLTRILTESVKDQLDKYGSVNLVDSESEADATLRVKVLDVERSTGAVRSNVDTAVQYDTTLRVAAELRRTNGVIIWQDPALSATTTYGTEQGVVSTGSADFVAGGLSSSDLASLGVGGTRGVARAQEQSSLASLSDKIAQQIYDAAVAPEF